MTQSTTYNKAGVFRRLAAMIYDSLLICAILMVISAIFVTANHSEPAKGLFFQISLGLSMVFFYCWFWLHGGQTLGMQAWRLKLVSQDHSPLTFFQCLIRIPCALLSFAALGIGYFWIWLDKDKRAFHDILSGTSVIILDKNNCNTKQENKSST